MTFLIVFLGAGLGGCLRHGLNLVGKAPFTTMLINISGSLAMGLIISILAHRTQWPQSWRLFLTTGVLGGYTTFSTFSLETALLLEKGQRLAALGYSLGSVLLGLLALLAGMKMGATGT